MNINAFKQELRNHPDKERVDRLIEGLKNGFDIGVKDPPHEQYECKNLRSALKEKDFVAAALKTELNQGYIMGPFFDPPFDYYRVSPLGVAIGKYSGKKRLILDLSSPHGEDLVCSVNSGIDKAEFSLQYVTIDHAMDIIMKLGRGALLTKVDVKDAFRILPVKPEQWPHLCVKWEDKYYCYVRLPFGSRSSPKIFTYLSEAIHWIVTQNYGIKNLLFLLDDFLAIDHKEGDGAKTRQILLSVFDKLGVTLNDKKTEGPSTELEYLGIILDSEKMQARLPQAKLDRIREFLRTFTSSVRCTKRDLLRLLGHLNFASRVVYHGRTFMARLIEASTTASELFHWIYLSDECKEDIYMWTKLLTEWNGVSMFHRRDCVSSVDLTIFTDSSSTIGFGAFYRDRNQAFWDTWANHPLPVTSDSMSYIELYPIVLQTLCVLSLG